MQQLYAGVWVTAQLIGKRIKALREKRGFTQEKLAEMFGYKDRQTVSAIETGARQVTAEELVLAVGRLGASLEYFTDPFLLAGEGRFSWRQTGVGAQQLEAYEQRAGRWIAAFRALTPLVGREAPLMRRKLNLHAQPSSTFQLRGRHVGWRAVSCQVRSGRCAGNALTGCHGAGTWYPGSHG